MGNKTSVALIAAALAVVHPAIANDAATAANSVPAVMPEDAPLTQDEKDSEKNGNRQVPSATLQRQTQEVLMQALSLIGVKYRFGGNSAETGFDCSGFVRHVFTAAAAMELPRSSYAMSRLGNSIDHEQIEPGDLLYYNTRRRPFSHVAIYLGDGRFIHAPSKGKQVEIVDMTDAYWKKRFNGARRLLLAD